MLGKSDIMPVMSTVTAKKIRFSVAEYMRMSEAGIFGGRRTELVAGRIIKMAPQLNPHRWAISKINHALVRIVGPRDWLVIEGTLFLGDDSAPEPDFQLFGVPMGTPDEQLPLPILVIEVSNKTYKRDSGSKLRAYAKAGIQDYWIVNLQERRVEVYRKPENPTGAANDWHYASVVHLLPGQIVSLLKRPFMSFPVADLLP
jgi:Uma2 family endonuclease